MPQNPVPAYLGEHLPRPGFRNLLVHLPLFREMWGDMLPAIISVVNLPFTSRFKTRDVGLKLAVRQIPSVRFEEFECLVSGKSAFNIPSYHLV